MFKKVKKIDEAMIENLRDERWRLSNLYKIKTKQGKIVTFKPNRAQTEFLDSDEGKSIILKARQMGISTVCLLRLLDKTIWTPNTTSVILAHKKESVQKLFKIIKFAYDHFAKDVGLPKPKAKYDNKNELYFEETNSTIYVSTEVRGDTINNLHVSELAFMAEAEDKMIATFAAVVPGGLITIESTANGVGDYFYDFYHEAEERGFKPHFFPWYWADEYVQPVKGLTFSVEDRGFQNKHGINDEQLAWWLNTKSLFKEKFPQEYPSNAAEAFLASGGNVFPVKELAKIETKTPLVETDYFVWEHPKWGQQYTVGVDVSEGIGIDESSIDVINMHTGEQVWHWSGRCEIPLLAEKVEGVCKLYNNALCIPEANNHGYALIYMLKDRGLRIYRREKLDGPVLKRTQKLGWQTNKRTKPLMIQAVINAIYEGSIQINHKKTIGQMRTYIIDPETGSMNAAVGKKDDCVISLLLAWQGIRMAPTQENIPMSAIDFEQETESSFTGISY